MHWPFIPHRTYSRKLDLHGAFGGQEQGGISTPAKFPVIFAIYKVGGNVANYHDRFQADGSLLYTGEGQSGPMTMKGGNGAIRDHVANGKDLLIFSQHVKGGPVTYKGQFVCAGWQFETQRGRDGLPRQAIVFTLDPLLDIDWEAAEITAEAAPMTSLQDLRARAYKAATNAAATTVPKVRSTYERARDVRNYVLARANGVCEACHLPAPFKTASGRPYLEAHHVRRLSDGGPDDPRYVAGICPTCHRRAHHAADRQAFNNDLTDAILALESVI